MDKLLVVTEFCPGGNLQKFLPKSRISYSPEDSKPNLTSTLSDSQLFKLATDVAIKWNGPSFCSKGV